MKKLVALLLTLSILFCLVPNTNASAKSKKDTGPAIYYLDKYSERAIRYIVFSLVYQSFPIEGETTEEYANLFTKRLPNKSFNKNQLNSLLDKTWEDLDGNFNVYDHEAEEWTRDQLLGFSTSFSGSSMTEDNEYIPSKTKYRSTNIAFYIKDTERALNLYNILAEDLNNYYGSVNIETIEEFPDADALLVTTNTIDVSKDNDTAVMYMSLPEAKTLEDGTEVKEGYMFMLLFYEPNAIDYPGEIAYNMFYAYNNKVEDAFKAPKVTVENNKKGTVKISYDKIKDFERINDDISKGDTLFTIEYADNKEFENSTTIGTRALKRSIKGLEKGTTYYFRITEEVNTEHYRYVSKVSKIKNITIEK